MQARCGKCGRVLKVEEGPGHRFLLCLHCGTSIAVRPTRTTSAAPTATPAVDGHSASAPGRGPRDVALVAFGVTGLVSLAVAAIVVFGRPGGGVAPDPRVAEASSNAPVPLPEPWRPQVDEPVRPAEAVEAVKPAVDRQPASARPPRPALPEVEPPTEKPQAAPDLGRPTNPDEPPKSPARGTSDEPPGPKGSADGATPAKEAEPAPATKPKEPAPPAPMEESKPQAAARGSADPEVKQFEGRWKIWRVESINGVTAEATDSMLIGEDQIRFIHSAEGKGATARFTVDPAKDPKEIDVVYTSGSATGKKQLGIYRFPKRGQLEISLADFEDVKRPRKFTGRLTPGSGKSYVIYRSEEYQDPPEVVQAMKKLEGRWSKAGSKTEGLLIEDDGMEFLWGGNNKGNAARFVVDPGKNPPEIEIVYTRGPWIYKRQIGIYRRLGDKLELCLSELDGDKRPTRFGGASARVPGGGANYLKYVLQDK